MSRLRISIATIVAVAMMSLGAAACTPAQQAEIPQVLGEVIGFIIVVVLGNSLPSGCSPPGCF